MENAEALQAPEVNGVVVKEDKKTVAKLWEKAVKTGVSIEKLKIKATPAMIKIAGLLAPELSPVLVPLSKFLKKHPEYLNKVEKNYDAMGEALTGNTEPLKENAKDTIGFLNSDEGTEYIKDSIELAKGIGGK